MKPSEMVPTTVKLKFHLKTGQSFVSTHLKDFGFTANDFTKNTIHRLKVGTKDVFVQGDNIAYVEGLY